LNKEPKFIIYRLWSRRLSPDTPRVLEMSRKWIIAGVAAVCLVVGIVLSHRIEPGVRVEKVMLTKNTPALRIFPATSGPYPKALLAHGNGGSKEMLFRFGEALAAAGFDCYSVDQVGYGESPLPWSLTNILLNLHEVEQAIGAVDVFIGHSMGGANGAWSVRETGFRPKLFVGVGAPVELGRHGPRNSCWQVYLRKFADRPNYTH
jgi:hypothetical protein